MPNLCEPSEVDDAAARKRLAALTADAAALAGFDRMAASDDIDGEFVAALDESGISLDHVVWRRGEPYAGGTDAMSAEFLTIYRRLEALERESGRFLKNGPLAFTLGLCQTPVGSHRKVWKLKPSSSR